MDAIQQARAVSVDLALKLLATHGKQGRPPRAAEVVEVAKVLHAYIKEGR